MGLVQRSGVHRVQEAIERVGFAHERAFISAGFVTTRQECLPTRAAPLKTKGTQSTAACRPLYRWALRDWRENGVWGAMERKVRLATAVSGVSERPELATSDRFRYGERVASQQVDVLVAER